MKDYFKYTNKVCLVTGASSGMGKATVEMLVDLGAKVYAVDINKCPVKGIEKFIKCDLSKKEDIDKLFDELPLHIDSFFGIAGLSGAKTDYITTFNCNYTANMYITLNYLRTRMLEGSSIVYVTSTAGLAWKKFMKEQDIIVHEITWEEVQPHIEKLAKKSPSVFAYMYSKRCLSQFACEQAIEFGKLGIRINNVMPGSTDTGMKDEFEKMAGGEEALLNETGTAHRLATSEEMAGPIVFLNSAMSSFVSGVDLCVDSADTCLKTLKLKDDRESVSATNGLILMISKKMMEKEEKQDEKDKNQIKNEKEEIKKIVKDNKEEFDAAEEEIKIKEYFSKNSKSEPAPVEIEEEPLNINDDEKKSEVQELEKELVEYFTKKDVEPTDEHDKEAVKEIRKLTLDNLNNYVIDDDIEDNYIQEEAKEKITRKDSKKIYEKEVIKESKESEKKSSSNKEDEEKEMRELRDYFKNKFEDK